MSVADSSRAAFSPKKNIRVRPRWRIVAADGSNPVLVFKSAADRGDLPRERVTRMERFGPSGLPIHARRPPLNGLTGLDSPATMRGFSPPLGSFYTYVAST